MHLPLALDVSLPPLHDVAVVCHFFETIT
jgi:hypothetical protein